MKRVAGAAIPAAIVVGEVVAHAGRWAGVAADHLYSACNEQCWSSVTRPMGRMTFVAIRHSWIASWTIWVGLSLAVAVGITVLMARARRGGY